MFFCSLTLKNQLLRKHLVVPPFHLMRPSSSCWYNKRVTFDQSELQDGKQVMWQHDVEKPEVVEWRFTLCLLLRRNLSKYKGGVLISPRGQLWSHQIGVSCLGWSFLSWIQSCIHSSVINYYQHISWKFLFFFFLISKLHANLLSVT